MKGNSEVLLDEASRDELAACIRLLAVSVVQHRARCDFVTIENSMAQLNSGNQFAIPVNHPGHIHHSDDRAIASLFDDNIVKLMF